MSSITPANSTNGEFGNFPLILFFKIDLYHKHSSMEFFFFFDKIHLWKLNFQCYLFNYEHFYDPNPVDDIAIAATNVLR